MCHAWNTHWTADRALLTMPRRRSTRDERTHGRYAREPFLAHTRAHLASQAPVFNRDAHDERVNQRTEHGEQPTYQIEHS